MSIHLYYSNPHSPLKFDDYLHYTKAVADWIVFVEDNWPHTNEEDPYFDGVVIAIVDERAACNLAKWGKAHLLVPALVFIDKPISSFRSTVPPTGFTHSEAPSISFATI